MTTDIIHLLPDSIANQIAAGEVIQRPASVVKELVENALDAGANRIRIIIKDAGRTLVQVMDNGSGMSDIDARMAFERHATSKISNANDLFALHTMGFRGEALASIAAVAQVELKTRLKGAELGTRLVISGSNIETTETVTCDEGSSFAVKNIFFNIPARRKFLKSNDYEFRNILSEVERVALANPDIEIILYRDDTETLHLPASGLLKRIVNTCGKNFNNSLLPIDVDTSMTKITGFTGRPETSRKRGAMQYFFVNGRYMRHPYFHKAVMTAYESIIPAGEQPSYFIYFFVDPSTIDVNIHPTKTEIKFENELAIWQILMAAIRETLAKSNAVPSIEFDMEDPINIPVFSPNNPKTISPPTVQIDPRYNPFKTNDGASYKSSRPDFNWDALYKHFEGERSTTNQETPEETPTQDAPELSFDEQNFTGAKETARQHRGRYLITALKSGLVIIDQHRAHVRICFDRFFAAIQNRRGFSQRMLFPEAVEFTPQEADFLPAIMDDLHFAGFELSPLGNNTYAVNATPDGLDTVDIEFLLKEAVSRAMETGEGVHADVSRSIALSLAKAAAIPVGKPLSAEERENLIADLFSSQSPSYTPDGKRIMYILTDEELAKQFR
jgi:DNA mismatch repair protein MutL